MATDEKLKFVSGLFDFLNGDSKKDQTPSEDPAPKVEKTAENGITQEVLNKALAELAAEKEAEKEAEKAKSEVLNNAEKDDVVDYKGKFEKFQNDLVVSKVEKGFADRGIDIPNFDKIKELFKVDSLKTEAGDPDPEKIDEFVKVISGIATKTPPKGSPKKTSTKAGIGRYLEEQ